MQPKAPKLLEDIRSAAEFIFGATRDLSCDAYRQNATVRFAVERNFEIIGEALHRLTRADSETAGRISDSSRIIGFRNVLIHGYDLIDDERVWEVLRGSLPKLHEQVTLLLRESDT